MAKQINTKKTNEKKKENKKKVTKEETNKNTKKVVEKKENTKPNKKVDKNYWSQKPQKAKIPTDEVTKLVEVILVLLVVFAAFYIITYWVKKAKTKTSIDQTEVENMVIQYDEILMGRLFMQNNNEYYVLIIDKEDENNYQTYLTSYKEKENALRFYTVNLGNAFNKNYKADTSKLDTSEIKELKVKETTLVRIKERKIEESFEGKTKVIEKLGELIK